MAKFIICKGKVQGVCYRASTKKTADQLGVRGWVRNEPNGDVAIHAEGDAMSIQKLTEWCWKGPVGSKVTDVVYRDAEDQGFSDFRIRHDTDTVQ